MRLIKAKLTAVLIFTLCVSALHITAYAAESPAQSLSDSGQAVRAGRCGALIAEAGKYLGFPYRWGGSTPETSFDCSGFVCWALNRSGAAVIERTTAQGIFNFCEPVPEYAAEPGDLIFFHSTYPNAPNTVTHTGIYTGNGQMLHCGGSVQYESIDTDYWRAHLYSLARLP